MLGGLRRKVVLANVAQGNVYGNKEPDCILCVCQVSVRIRGTSSAGVGAGGEHRAFEARSPLASVLPGSLGNGCCSQNEP